MNEIICVNNLSITLQNKSILHQISFSIKQGEFIGIIGPNGAGKSTLIKAISKMYQGSEGSIILNNKDIHYYSRRELAHYMAVVSAELYIPYDFTVFDIISMGRAAYTNMYGRLTLHDTQKISQAMQATDTHALLHRLITTLSSGEKQRVFIAQALAQEPSILLLDEPTAHLDINHQKEIMDLLWKLNSHKHLTILMASHDINCAADYCSRLLLIKEGALLNDGKPNELLDEDHMIKLYGISVRIISNPASHNPHVLVVPERYEGQRSAFSVQDEKPRL